MEEPDPKQVEKEDVNEIIQERKGDSERYDPQDAAIPETSTADFEGDLLDEWRSEAGRAADRLSSAEDSGVLEESGKPLRESFEEQYA